MQCPPLRKESEGPFAVRAAAPRPGKWGLPKARWAVLLVTHICAVSPWVPPWFLGSPAVPGVLHAAIPINVVGVSAHCPRGVEYHLFSRTALFSPLQRSRRCCWFQGALMILHKAGLHGGHFWLYFGPELCSVLTPGIETWVLRSQRAPAGLPAARQLRAQCLCVGYLAVAPCSQR